MTALFFLLLIYTLFFALPFEETYVTQNGCKTYDRGMYALCRHPGVLWFTGCYLFLWMTFGGKELLLLAMINCLLNFLYVVLQDGVTFPRVFTDYNIYKQRVPFLIPTVKSIQMCIRTWKK
jgi:protein-S-isoprenylcysteine O-methyltransferase Ste14